MVELFFEETAILDLDPEFFVLWLEKLCKKHNRSLGDINIILCSDEYLLQMNKDHLQHDYYTDIITFNYNDDNKISGDLFISVDRVRENAAEHRERFPRELNRVIAHGVLHLIGFNDKTDQERLEMRTRENEALELIVSRET